MFWSYRLYDYPCHVPVFQNNIQTHNTAYEGFLLVSAPINELFWWHPTYNWWNICSYHILSETCERVLICWFPYQHNFLISKVKVKAKVEGLICCLRFFCSVSARHSNAIKSLQDDCWHGNAIQTYKSKFLTLCMTSNSLDTQFCDSLTHRLVRFDHMSLKQTKMSYNLFKFLVL